MNLRNKNTKKTLKSSKSITLVALVITVIVMLILAGVTTKLTVGVLNTEKNQTFDKLTTGTSSNPIIPKGFAPINENGAKWGTADGFEKGLVIQDADGNQFVWVPIDDAIVKYERFNWGKGEANYNSCSEIAPQ